MKLVRSLSRAACVLSVCGMLVPNAVIAAPAAPAKAAVAAKDVSLAPNGGLVGVLVNPTGQPVDGAVISVRRGGKEVAQTVSSAQGTFEVAGLSSGVYEVAVGQNANQIRVWPSNVAPPSASKQPVFVVGNATRGQYGTGLSGIDFISLTTLGASVTAAVLAGITLGKVNDVEDELKSP
ncbi:carboxypeptidase-like regulatory domain-containing protein [Planctomicrobium sp. SH664]|uniref:carboxypeptidase-like regulatory domain-containing protein n=1 Tax=Planctomicrobium sp. SH664 TaxID=3448125 RepID=UPI003F5B868D